MINRREFLASTAIAMAGPRAVAASEREERWEADGVGSLARIGVLTPDDDPVPESEMRMMAPDGVSIHSSRVLWKNGDWHSFADGAPSAAELLTRLKTRLILYAFTSSSYVLGEEADGACDRKSRAGGVKVLFTCPAAVEALPFQELARLSRGLELRNGIQFLECRRERVGQVPDRPQPEFLVLGLEGQVMHGAGEVFGSFRFASHKTPRR